MQWGYFSSLTGNTNTNLSFPVTPTAIYNITAQIGNNTELSYTIMAWYSGAQGTIRLNGSHSKPVYWLAITK